MTSPPVHAVRLIESVPRLSVRGDAVVPGARAVPEECPVSIVYDGGSHAVMMASPADLEDFAIGFSLTEGVIDAAEDIESLDIVSHEAGLEVRLWLQADRGADLTRRRRRIAGPTGCGLCGIDSLEEAVRPPPRVHAELVVPAAEIGLALTALAPAQVLGRQTRAVHAAGFWAPGRGLLVLREDVGRHNALDKLVGAMQRQGLSAASGFVLLTSRVSVEMVQKAAVLGAPVLVAVSAPTALAVRTAAAAGVTLVGVAREDGFELFTHPGRIRFGEEGSAEL